MSQDEISMATREMNMVDRLQKIAFEDAKRKGWDEPLSEAKSFGDWCTLITSEVSEAYEDYRNHHKLDEIYYEDDSGSSKKYTLADTVNINWIQNKKGDRPTLFKPCGIPMEMADTVIRIMHIAEFAGFNLYNCIEEKMRYNRQRTFRHGNKKV